MPKTPAAQAVEISLEPNQTAASRGGMPKMNTWEDPTIVCPRNDSQNKSELAQNYFIQSCSTTTISDKSSPGWADKTLSHDPKQFPPAPKSTDTRNPYLSKIQLKYSVIIF